MARWKSNDIIRAPHLIHNVTHGHLDIERRASFKPDGNVLIDPDHLLDIGSQALLLQTIADIGKDFFGAPSALGAICVGHVSNYSNIRILDKRCRVV